MKLNKIHHVAVICSDYEESKHFYTDVLGMKIVSDLIVKVSRMNPYARMNIQASDLYSSVTQMVCR